MHKRKFIVTQGLPASGKSSWAKEYLKSNTNTVRINNDELQLMFFDKAFVKGASSLLTAARTALIHAALKCKNDIIIDNTNLAPARIEEYRKLIEEYNREVSGQYNYELVLKDFRDVPVATCIERNRKRLNPVPDSVIYDMYDQFIRKPIPVLEQDASLPKALLIDIDGTLAEVHDRSPFDYKKVYQDKVITAMQELIAGLADKFKLVYLTGREESCREDTLRWLKEKAQLRVDDLFMNKNGERVSSEITKIEIFNKFIKPKYFITWAIEDRHKNVKAFREIGLKVLQCDDGLF